MTSSVSSRLNADLLDENYSKWLDDPLSVDSNWASFFDGFELGTAQSEELAAEGDVAVGAPGVEDNTGFYGRVVSLVYNYRTLGHTQATINPLSPEKVQNPRLALKEFGLSKADFDKDATSRFFRKGKKITLGELVEELEETYSGNIGFEFMHIHNTEVRNWIRERIEKRPERAPLTKEEKANALKWALEAELLEEFIGKKFIGEKRFSLEGGEGMMVFLQRLLEECPEAGMFSLNS